MVFSLLAKINVIKFEMNDSCIIDKHLLNNIHMYSNSYEFKINYVRMFKLLSLSTVVLNSRDW